MMKGVKFWGFIHGIVAVAFIFMMIIAWKPKDFQFWCLFWSVLVILVNSFLLFWYVEKNQRYNSSPMDRALFVPVVAAFLAVIWMTKYLPGIVNYICNPYLAAHVGVFAVSFIVQFLLLRAREENLEQEQYIAEKRWNRDECVVQWGKIRTALSGRGEAEALAQKMEEEIRFSDPMSQEALWEMEEAIAELTEEILKMAENPESTTENIVRKEREMLIVVRERNDRCGRLK